METQETAEFESNAGVISLGRKVPHLVSSHLSVGSFTVVGSCGGTGAGPNQSVDLPELYLVLHSGCHFGNSMNLSGL